MKNELFILRIVKNSRNMIKSIQSQDMRLILGISVYICIGIILLIILIKIINNIIIRLKPVFLIIQWMISIILFILKWIFYIIFFILNIIFSIINFIIKVMIYIIKKLLR